MRHFDEDEKRLWQDVTRHITPLKKNKHVSQKRAPQKKTRRRTMSLAEPFIPISMKAYKAKKAQDFYQEIFGCRPQAKKGKNLLFSQIPPDGKLDLHGYTRQEAFYYFLNFMNHAIDQRLRCVHIVTGLGPEPDGGVLRQEVPLWLKRHDIAPYILQRGYVHHANKGAIYVILKR